MDLVLPPGRNDLSIAQGFGFVVAARARGDTRCISSSRAGATELKNKRAAGHYASGAALGSQPRTIRRAELWAFSLCLLCAACGSDSAEFTPSEAASAGGEQPAAPSETTPPPATASPTAEAPADSARADVAPEAAPATGANAVEAPQLTAADSNEAPTPTPTPASPKAAPPPSPKPASVQPAAAGPKPASKPSATPAQAQPASSAPAAKPTEPGPASASQPAAAPQPAAPAAPVAHVIVELRGLKSDAGKIQAALFRTAAGFPQEPNKAAVRKLAKISGKKVDLSFDVDPPGTFVVLVHHDENNDSKMQRGAFGQPAEGWGATRDPAANFGPPSFDDAKLTIKAGETKHVVIKMRY